MKNKILKFYNNLSIVKKATVWFFICSVLQKGIAFITTPIFTRLLSTEEYGTYSIYISWFQILTLISSLRLDYAVFNKGMAKFEKEKDLYTATMQTISTFICIILCIVFFIFRNFITNFIGLKFGYIILMIINVACMNSINFWYIRERYEYKYKNVVLVTLTLTILTTLIGIICVEFSKHKDFSRIVSLAIIQSIVGFVIFIIVYKKSKKIFKYEFLKFALKFNLPLIPHFFSIYILEQSDKIMIQKLIGISEVGLYSVACSIGNVITIFISCINQTIIPWLYENLKNKNFVIIKKRITSIFVIMMIISIFFILCMPELIHIIFSNAYNSIIDIIAPITVSVFYMLIYGILSTIEFYYDKNKFSMIISSCAAIVNIVLNILFLQKYGYGIAGYTTMISYALLAIGHLLYTNKIVQIKEAVHIVDNRVIIAMLNFMLLIGFIIQIINPYAIIRYLCIICIVIYFFINRKKYIDLIFINNKIEKEKK